MYTREQVYEATLKYFNGNELAATVWVNKYCLKKENVYFELTPTDMHWRLSKEFNRIEMKYPNPMTVEEIYLLLKDFKYIVPQGSPMAGIGNNHSIMSISNCLVIGNHIDSYGGIFSADQKQAQLMKRRCGVGQDMSWLRPSGALAGGSELGPNAGATLYMDRFSNTTKEVQQDGRRGALMLTIDIKHPDAGKFIDKKLVDGSVTGANISVKISDIFMNSLRTGDSFYQTFPIHLSVGDVATDEQKNMILYEDNKLYLGKVVNGIQTYFKKVDPKKIWDKIIHNAWKSAEPGILFWDNIIFESPARGYGKAWAETSTNPCGEIPLPPDDSCRLLLLNLYSYVFNAFSKNPLLEDVLLVDHVKKAMRLMDDIVDLEIEKIDLIIENIKSKSECIDFQKEELELWIKIKQKAIDGRRTGLGITGEGDLIAALGYKYGTPDATIFAERLHQLIATAAYESSIELAEERGAFPIWDKHKDLDSNFLVRMFGEDNDIMTEGMRKSHLKTGRRNIAILTIAPAGSVSLLTETSSGIEPVFSVFHYRKRKLMGLETEFDWEDENGEKWIEYPVFHKPFIHWYSAYMNIRFEAAKEILNGISKEKLNEVFKLSPYYRATSQDVDYIEKVRMQGGVQKWVDHSISVTVNMPENVTEELVANVYQEAYKSGCKGITIYRDNSRGNVLSTESVKKNSKNEGFEYVSAHKRPKSIECDIYFKSAGKKPFIFFVGLIEGKPYEMFGIPYNDETKFSKTIKKGTITKLGRGKYTLTGENDMTLIESITEHMIETEQNETRSISALLRHRVDPKWIRKSIIEKYATINSFHKVSAKVLGEYIKNGNECPECSEEMTMTEGCMKCPECGYSHCG